MTESLRVDIGSDYVRIYDVTSSQDEGLQEEIVGWTMTEWLEDFEVVNSIFNAINLAHTNPELLLKNLGKGRN